VTTPNPQRLYDMVFLIVPDKDEAGTLAVIDEFRKLLVDNGATIEKDESMGRRRLAYAIKKRSEATYHNFLFRGSAACVAEVQRKMRLSEEILRFLSVRVDEEMKHGAKVARNTKPRRPRPEMSDSPSAASPTVPMSEPAGDSRAE
jgi:small subunit ribosomal protein S6